MDSILKNHTILHEYSRNEILMKVKVEDLLTFKVVNWEHNRPPDETRCNEIKEHFIKSNTIINTPFHFHLNKKNQLECLDGIHRYTALELVEDKSFVNDKFIIAFIYLNKTYGELIDIFMNINKSINVPDLYKSSDYVKEDKQMIEETVKTIQMLYPTHFSSSRDYRVPQMNRDVFIEILTEVMNKYNMKSKELLLDFLNRCNDYIRIYMESPDVQNKKLPKNHISEKQLEKCKMSGCYLFLFKRNILEFIIFPKNL